MLDSLWNTISDWMGSTFSSLLESILNATLFKLFYYLEKMLCWIISILTELFGVFAGIEKVTYGDDAPVPLINIFFSNKAVSNIYWAFALIGVVFTLGFAIWSVVKKTFDSSGKVQQSLGEIITTTVRSIFLILGLSLIMNAVLYGCNVVMGAINDIFNDAWHLNEPVEREFTPEEYATMGRVLATIGNYSVVSSSNNRYNINLCYNDIREDMLALQEAGVFNYAYSKPGKDGELTQSWQSVLLDIAKSANLNREVKIDQYNQDIAQSISAAMDYLRNNGIVKPEKKAVRNYITDNNAHLDRMVFLMGTMGAAKNPMYNDAPSLEDAVRGPYYYNEGKSIYSYDNVVDDFDIGFKTDYIVVWIAAVAIIIDLAVIILNCIARIFNMLFLYIIAPPIIAAYPLDNGGKFKQWTTAFLVQSLSVFGTVIAMRMLMIFIPIIIDPKLEIFSATEQPLLNQFAKFLLVFGGFEAAKKSTALLTGILADSAGWQAIQAGDMSGTAMGAISKVAGIATGAAKWGAGKAVGIAGSVVGTATRPLTNLAKRPFNAASKWWNSLGTGNRQRREEQSIKDRISQGKADESYLATHEGDRKYLAPNTMPRDNPPGPNGNPPGQQNPGPQQGNELPNQNHPAQDNQLPPDNGQLNQQGNDQPIPAPPLPERYQMPADDTGIDAGNNSASMNNLRQNYGFDNNIGNQDLGYFGGNVGGQIPNNIGQNYANPMPGNQIPNPNLQQPANRPQPQVPPPNRQQQNRPNRGSRDDTGHNSQNRPNL